MIHLVVLCGGVSPEHEISVRSAKNVLNAIDRKKYEISLIGISKKGKWLLLEEEQLGKEVLHGAEVSIRPGTKSCFVCNASVIDDVDVVFPLLHGPNGEDGAIQGLLQMIDLPFVGPGILGSSMSMDKDITKQLLAANSINVAGWRTLVKGPIPSYEEIAKELGEVVFVKPANMGSSVGVSRVDSEHSWSQAIQLAFSYDEKVLVESELVGRELECAVLGNEDPEASGIGEVLSGEVYTYDKKYASDSDARVVIPADLTEDEWTRLRETAVEAYKTLECKGLSRVDMFLTESGEVFVNEINTMPGFTNISMYPKLWETEGKPYAELIDDLVDLALEKD